MYTLYKFHFLNGISEINLLFDDILIIWPAPVYPPKKQPLKNEGCHFTCRSDGLFLFKLAVLAITWNVD